MVGGTGWDDCALRSLQEGEAGGSRGLMAKLNMVTDQQWVPLLLHIAFRRLCIRRAFSLLSLLSPPRCIYV